MSTPATESIRALEARWRGRRAVRYPQIVTESAKTPSRAEPSGLAGLVERLETLADRRLASHPVTDASRARATSLRDHLAGHLRVRAKSLDAPLLVLILGPTGAGKSSLFNALVGRAASRTGVLRPTTRTAVVVASPLDVDSLKEGALATLEPGRVALDADPSLPRGLAIVDAPDIDSVEHSNRAIADHLAEAADLCLFVTTATRYADRVPWQVLARVRERGLPLVVVVNRLPPDDVDQRAVVEDVGRLFAEAGFGTSDSEGADQATPGILEPGRLLIVPIGEGDVNLDGEALSATAVAPIAAVIRTLRDDRDARLALVARALAGALGGLSPLVEAIADDSAHESIDAAALRRTAAGAFERELVALRNALGSGGFLREEALRHWHDYVAADDVTRIFSKGIGAIRGAISSIFRPSTAPVAEVRQATTDDLLAVARLHAAEAARQTASAWADDPRAAATIAADPSLWDVSPEFEPRLRERLDAWLASIATDISETGEGKRRLAKGASIGVNAIGVGVMVATFAHTAGLTGTEVGIAAGTAFLNQKLLAALFGEAALVELIGRARARLDAALAASFADERTRFEILVPAPDELETLAADLRNTAADVRTHVEARAGDPVGADAITGGLTDTPLSPTRT